MDKIILLPQHTKNFIMEEITSSYDDYGNAADIKTEKVFTGALLPLSKSDLQMLERGQVEFKDKKIYTKQDFKVDDKFKDSNNDYWKVVAELDYMYVADIKVYSIRRTD